MQICCPNKCKLVYPVPDSFQATHFTMLINLNTCLFCIKMHLQQILATLLRFDHILLLLRTKKCSRFGEWETE